MAQDWSKPFYNSVAWRKLRKSYVAKRRSIDGGMCQECESQLGYIVHHKIPLTPKNITDPFVTLNPTNLMYVCKECHDRYDNHGVLRKRPDPPCIFDSNGQPIGRLK